MEGCTISLVITGKQIKITIRYYHTYTKLAKLKSQKMCWFDCRATKLFCTAGERVNWQKNFGKQCDIICQNLIYSNPVTKQFHFCNILKTNTCTCTSEYLYNNAQSALFLFAKNWKHHQMDKQIVVYSSDGIYTTMKILKKQSYTQQCE